MKTVLFFTMQMCSLLYNMGIMTRFMAHAGLKFPKKYQKCIENDKATLQDQVISSSVVAFYFVLTQCDFSSNLGCIISTNIVRLLL